MCKGVLLLKILMYLIFCFLDLPWSAEQLFFSLIFFLSLKNVYMKIDGLPPPNVVDIFFISVYKGIALLNNFVPSFS